MENFEGIFPTQSALISPFPLSMADSFGYGDGDAEFEGGGGKANGLLGLMAEMEAPATFNNINDHDHHHHHHPNIPTNSTATNGHDDQEEVMMMKLGKKTKKMKKPRYAFQTRSRVDILDDGYRWRKYGQKAVKNNKFPRSYYRCTHQGCNVKKQVQRLTKDEEVVVTTYEGMHSHPIQKSNDNFEHILSQMQIYTSF